MNFSHARVLFISRAFSNIVSKAPAAYTQLLVALNFALGPSYEVVIVGNPQAEDARAMLKTLRRKFIPNKVVLFRSAEEEFPEIARFAEFIRFLSSREGKATAYICRNYKCNVPTTDVGKVLELLDADHR